MTPLLADENYPRPVVLFLRAAGYDVVTIQELGMDGTPDPQVLVYAASVGRAVLTEDKGYRRWHRLNPAHAGIIICSHDPYRQRAATRIHAAIVAAPILAGQVIRVNRPHRAAP